MNSGCARPLTGESPGSRASVALLAASASRRYAGLYCKNRMSVTLDQIVAATRVRVAARKRVADVRALEKRAAERSPRGFRLALERRAAQGPAVIAELKKASPSKGVLRESLDVERIAGDFGRAGAAALSVLTEEDFFLGSLENLRRASAACAGPCLRKDFIVDEYQLIEARANCADAVLLLASVLDDKELKRLYGAATALELDVLCEAHDERELQRALDAGCNVVGVNSRDLRTFHVDLGTALKLAERIPDGVVKVAESGIHSAEDVKNLRAAGYHAFLIGELLMKADDPGQALRELVSGF
jgi:indole-3-glycerol phosphate synthase